MLARFASIDGDFSWPAKRSWMIVDELMCVAVPRTFLPPPTLDPARSIRQQMIDVTKGGCMGCHSLLNSPGFAFIGFDIQGRWRPAPGHGPGETEGWIPQQVLEDEPHFEGPEQLARLLISRPRATQCIASVWLQYAVDDKQVASVPPQAPDIQRSLPATYAAFARAGFQLRHLPIAIVRSSAFAGLR
jgi:hypothetical protein